ncbi:MAG: carbonic anhydrase family protein [Limnoraphis robusta]|uniref:carbonic anhydrase n=1 Tax=Limnoraphis robusta TaxID=1118279 RepID=UPI002B21A102|nr:carbonic anhydrase family protein [Limnoraphis robusta]MEA5499694.1 carbonic anhydrase family protein [Limnoraphis robusta BA-68 BA1]
MKKIKVWMMFFIIFIFTMFIIPVACSKNQLHTGEWGYRGEMGPENWGELKEEFVVCETGQQQSPINIETSATPKAKIEFSYDYTPLNVINKGHTIEIEYEPGSTIKIDNKQYELLQFHFHSPSEHQLDGKSYPMEVHLVHKSSDGKFAVIGILIEEGTENRFIASLWPHVPKEIIENPVRGVAINASALPPENKVYYNYTGSLTTPPCSEGVNWIVFETPIEVSSKQIEYFRSFYNGNARPIQPLNERQVI